MCPFADGGRRLLSACFCLALGIFAALGYLDVNINMGGYLFIGGILFTLWLVVLARLRPAGLSDFHTQTDARVAGEGIA